MSIRLLSTVILSVLLAEGSAYAATPAPKTESAPLLCYVGGTMRPSMEKLAKAYEAKTGQKILLDYGESGTQMIKVRETGKGDLLVVHDPYLGMCKKQGIADSGFVVARLEGVIVVPKGNPKKIAKLEDLTAPGIKVILTDSTYSTLGHIMKVVARKANLFAQIEKNIVTRTKSSGEAANAVGLGTGDAAVVWNAVAFLRKDKLDIVPINPAYAPDPKVDAITSATFGDIDMSCVKVTVITLKPSQNLAAARKFAAYTASAEGAKVWKAEGFSGVCTK